MSRLDDVIGLETMPNVPRLEPGDSLDRVTFHTRYRAMPEHVRAELVEGIVHMPPPVQRRHGRPHSLVQGWLTVYSAATPGTEAYDNATVCLSEDGEPQPDAFLLIRPDCGGRTRVDADDYVVGPPELVIEIASSSASIDLHGKRRDYERAGVQEYLVVLVREARVLWLERNQQVYTELPTGPDGILRSNVFPGLWLDPAAFLRNDAAAVLAVLQRGLGSSEHADFVARLTSTLAL